MFGKFQLGHVELQNRIVMAPMTRARADRQGVVGDIHAEYYAQRASAGLIITEGTAPSKDGLGYARTPGIFTDQQIKGWREVTDAVHREGGKIFLQIMHVGRIAHPLNQLPGARIIAPSAIAAKGHMYTDQEGAKDFPVPQEMTKEDIRQVIAEYAQATRNADIAGFDGVELHAANGYLPNQFLSSSSNQRTDDYGGSAANRVRFVVELVDAMAAAWSPDRVGVRVSPGSTFNDMFDAEPLETHVTLARELSRRGLAYLHVLRSEPFAPAEKAFDALAVLKKEFNGTLIANNNLDATEGEELIKSGAAELVSFGRPFIANPDFVERVRHGWPLSEADGSTFYTPGVKGFTDYRPYAPKPVVPARALAQTA
ncbi:MAG TPA: alkene reductase [Tepidisphaeraceae bacterium]|jgi:N-ethylmaleimide reductase